MHYKDFPLKDKRYINGVLAQYMDAYIRKTQIWTPQQMYMAFLEERINYHKKGWFGPRKDIDGEWVSINKDADLWLATNDAEDHIMEMFTNKYVKNSTLARKKDPLVQRLRFGPKRQAYDLNYGLKLGHRYEKTEKVESLEQTPWSIEHVNSQLNDVYNTNLLNVFKELSTTEAELIFKDYWIKKYSADALAPALVPKVFGDRKQYYCQKLGYKYSLTRFNEEDEHPLLIYFDFAIIHYTKQIRLLIDINHTTGNLTRDALNYKTIKEAIAAKQGWSYCAFNKEQVLDNVSKCFKELKDFFELS